MNTEEIYSLYKEEIYKAFGNAYNKVIKTIKKCPDLQNMADDELQELTFDLMEKYAQEGEK